MTPLRRHQLAYLGTAGWRALLDQPMDAQQSAHLHAWAQRGFPLVVTHQGCLAGSGEIALGWPAPPACGRLRVAFRLPSRVLGWLEEFPHARQAVPLLPRAARPQVLSLLDALGQLGVHPRVYGSYGWQQLTALPYVHSASDLDLWMAVRHHEQADAAVQLLQGCTPKGLRIDGELMFPDGAGVAWREYAAWRSGRSRGLLVKRLDSMAVETALGLPHWCEGCPA